MLRHNWKNALCLGAFVGVVALPVQASGETAKRVGGHVGFVVPMVSHANGETVTVADDFVFGIPSGFSVARFGRFTLDLEAVPLVQNEPADISLELHPGVVASVGKNLAAGIRAAFDVEGRSWGFTPLLNRALYHARRHTIFAEGVLPVRFVDDANGGHTSVGVAVHVGVAF